MNFNEHLVSVILPTYNRGYCIGIAIQSVLDQTYQNWELLVIDDGSLDDTEYLVSAFCRLDSRILYFHKQNGGGSSARNLGLKHCTGKFVTFIDSDDCYDKHKIEFQLKASLKSNSNIILCSSKIYLNGIFQREKIPVVSPDLRLSMLNKERSVYAGTPLLFVNASLIFENHIFFDESLPAMQDWDFLFQLSKFSNYSVVNEFLYFEYRHDLIHVHTLPNVYRAKVVIIKKYQNLFNENPKAKEKWLKYLFNIFIYYNFFEFKDLLLSVLNSPFKKMFILIYSFLVPRKLSVHNIIQFLNGK